MRIQIGDGIPLALRVYLKFGTVENSTSLTPRRSTVILIHSCVFSSSSLRSTRHTTTSYLLRIVLLPNAPTPQRSCPSFPAATRQRPPVQYLHQRLHPQGAPGLVRGSSPTSSNNSSQDGTLLHSPISNLSNFNFVYSQPSEAQLATASVFLSLRKLALGELKDNSHTRKKPIGHINRPPNAFILFRCLLSICLPYTVTHPDLGAPNAPRCLVPVAVTSSAYPILLPPFGALLPIPSSLLGMRLHRMSRSSTSSSSPTTSSSPIPRMQQTKRNTARQT